MDDLQDRAGSSVNGTGTCATIDTPVTQPGSGAVLTLGGLIDAYQTHGASSYHKLRHHVRQNHEGTLRRLKAQHGDHLLSAVRPATIQVWYNDWSDGGKLAMAHTFVAQLRTLFGFGLLFLENAECERLSVVMGKLRFQHPERNSETMTADQASAVREQAHRRGWGSIALAQAFQFEIVLRQKDVLGEWIPRNSRDGDSDIYWRGQKWLRGIRWSEIDDDLILRHRTSKTQKTIDADLKLCPMIREEFAKIVYRMPDGPVILNELTGMPWSAAEFRRKWRILADQAGIPRTVKSMHSRSGGITEMFRAGVRHDAIQLAAAHSDLSMTLRYNRQNKLETRSEGQLLRVEQRNRGKGEGAAFAFLQEHLNDPDGECLIWPFTRDPRTGRGQMGHNGERHWAHRLMCELVNGPPPTPQHQASHICGLGHEGCVHPQHLAWKTNSENQLDRREHGTVLESWTRKFTPELIAELRSLRDDMTQMQLAERFGCSLGTVQYYLKYREQRGHEPGAADHPLPEYES